LYHKGPVALHGFNLFNSFSTPFSLILMSFIGLNGLNGEIPFDGILVVFSVVNTDVKHHDIPWMTTDIKRRIRKKQRLYNKSKKSKKPSHKKAFKDR
jgi:hypothetical protein